MGSAFHSPTLDTMGEYIPLKGPLGIMNSTLNEKHINEKLSMISRIHPSHVGMLKSVSL